MKDYFIFKPCKGDKSFKLVPIRKIDRKDLIEIITTKACGKIIADTSFVTVIEIGRAKITVNKKGEMIIREVDENEMEFIAGKIMRIIKNHFYESSG